MLMRQGDLLIRRIGKNPLGGKIIEDGVILRGEVTGHAHRLTGDGKLYETDGRLYLSVLDRATIIHEEHYPIPLTRGDYEVIRQRQYTSKDSISLVVD